MLYPRPQHILYKATVPQAHDQNFAATQQDVNLGLALI